MDKKGIVWILLVSVILVVILAFSIPALQKSAPDGALQKNPELPAGGGEGRMPQPAHGMEESKHLKTLIAFMNIGLIIPLFVIYAGIYRRMRSSFTLGLMAVIFALGMYAATSCPLIVSLLGGRTGDIGLFQILPDLCTTIALIILIRISLE